MHTADESQVAIVAIDEETFRRAPFAEKPKVMWTPELARVIDALLDAGVLVIGQDLILPTSVEAYLPGFDRDYLLALRRASGAGRLVLGEVQHSTKPLTPFPGHRFAAGGAESLRMVNLFQDPDGVIRRIPVAFTRMAADGARSTEPSFAVELAQRAIAARSGNGGTTSPMPSLPARDQRGMLLNFANGGRNLPVYSLADLTACLHAGDQEYFRQAFAGRVVIIGEVLDVEDRKLTSARFATGPDGAWYAERCRLPVMAELYDPAISRNSIPGVFVFATAVNNILRDEIMREVPTVAAALIVALAALLAASAVLYLPLGRSLSLALPGFALWTATAVILFQNQLLVPLLQPLAAGLFAAALTIGYRFAITDRARQRIERAFSYYLPASVVDRLVAQDRLPQLGGEVREVTIYLSDVADYTTGAEELAPEQTVKAMNRYFDMASDAIERHGGCVSSFAGDAILAIFGAPHDDPDHARHAVEAALECRDCLRRLAPELTLGTGRAIRARAGLATGPALIGNIGSSRRFHYTAMGDVVNLAARLEGANKYFGTEILVSATTAERLGQEIGVRPIERVRVQGREAPVMVFEPIGPLAALSDEDKASLERFRELARLRDRHAFGEALQIAEAAGEQVARVLARHLRAWKAKEWKTHEKPVFDLPQK